MTREAATLDSSWTVDEARRRLVALDRSPHPYPVLDPDGRLVGMLDASEIGRAADAGEGAKRLAELARPPSVHAHPDHSLDTVLVKRGRLGASALPVVSRRDTRKLLGVVSIQAIAMAMARAAEQEDAPTSSDEQGRRSSSRAT
jgi:CIC family chloride channel protein